MNSTERMILGLQVWWITFGMDEVAPEKLMEIEAIHGGFVWHEAADNRILSSVLGKYALTQKALDLIKEYDHGH